MVFSSVRADGLLLWTNKGATAHGDYLCLALADGFLELSFNLGKQRHLLVMRSLEPLNDGLWHSAVVLRNQRAATLTVDDQLAVSGESEPGATDLNTDGVLWIGESRDLHVSLTHVSLRGSARSADGTAASVLPRVRGVRGVRARQRRVSGADHSRGGQRTATL